VTDLVDTTEMYLRTILDLEEEGIIPLRARISERLGHSGPTVSQTVARMERDGLVTVAEDRRLVLTDQGRAIAIRVLRKHRIAEGLLRDVLGMSLAQVHDEACRWEHVMSDEAETRIYDLLGRPTESPYGTPIPGLAAFGEAEAVPFLQGVVSVTGLLATQGDGQRSRTVAVRRFGEPIQSDAYALALLVDVGVVPGANVTVEADGHELVIGLAGSSDAVRLPIERGDHIYLATER